MKFLHTPVLLNESMELLEPSSGENFIDCTLGGGGHSLEILKRIGPNGKLLGIDQDDKALKSAKEKLIDFSENIVLAKGNFVNLAKIVEENFSGISVNGILLDLGVSMYQLKNDDYGLSFESEKKLDMRLGDFETSAYEIINFYSKDDLVEIFKRYGEERWSNQIADEIIKVRQVKEIETPKELSQIAKKIYKWKMGNKTWRIHPATRIFQALRIEVNQELENLEKVLGQAVDILSSGGRLAVISFHSLEDRIVKHFFKQNKNIINQTKKPIVASDDEVIQNPASRSAKLRVIKKI